MQKINIEMQFPVQKLENMKIFKLQICTSSMPGINFDLFHLSSHSFRRIQKQLVKHELIMSGLRTWDIISCTEFRMNEHIVNNEWM